MLEIYKPRIEDLWFREKYLSDEETMSYNNPWGGVIPFPESEWKRWHDIWVNGNDGTHFYRYLKDGDTGDFVGEIAYHFDDDRDIWLADVIITSEYRGRGYGKQGLKMLCRLASENGIGILYDDIAIGNPAIALFRENGFTEKYRTDEYILLKKDLGDK